jgi:hypothetical protein
MLRELFEKHAWFRYLTALAIIVGAAGLIVEAFHQFGLLR